MRHPLQVLALAETFGSTAFSEGIGAVRSLLAMGSALSMPKVIDTLDSIASGARLLLAMDRTTSLSSCR